MAIEIERKFLVKNDDWRSLESGKVYRQGYILTQDKVTTIRIRIIGEDAYLTIKSKTEGISRNEFEYPIPLEDAKMMLDTLCSRPLIEKIRYKITIDNLVWEIDEFKGENEGLILAEVELNDENQEIFLPSWVGEEVTHDLRYYNVNLAKNPYQTW
ncbi:CYTH domain-containing protein [Crocosphaera sp. XPORK-15E]|uniref:CYTH domain-containing protein n=1 Tax=Crocosphaera sp. XPORK-15E TaxID=3110247 RepID=UPI002B1EB0C8|nr:CYTH domain-containing protein [Crocosphaera sp. XPORK-15E]MEA5535617.1 CYTH domain-containing protein [Crocosphaera sp. XPORK-15E]